MRTLILSAALSISAASLLASGAGTLRLSGTFLLAQGAALQTSPAAPAQGQAPGAPAAGGGRGGGFSSATPADWNDHEGWTQIFDGQTLSGWNCDSTAWSVADGAITAKNTAERSFGTVYCAWTGGEPADFELKAEFRMLVGGNSGIQYRSRMLPPRGGGPGGGRGPGGGPGGGGAPGAPAAAGAAAGGAAAAGGGRAASAAAGAPAAPASAPAAGTAPQAAPVVPCAMPSPVVFPAIGRGGPGGAAGRGPGGASAGGPGGGPGGGRGNVIPTTGPNIGGYQFDFDFTGTYPGQLYENGVPASAPAGTNTRGIITYKGQIVHLLPGGRREVIGCTGEANELKGVMNINNWNFIHIIARGNVLTHLLNGRLVTLTIDDDPARRKMGGFIAVQIEGTGEVYFRNLWLKTY